MIKDNNYFRKKAAAPNKNHRKLLALIMITCFLPFAALFLITVTLLSETRVLSTLLTFLLSVIVFPVGVLGSCHVFMRVLRGEKPRFGMILRYCNRNDFPVAILTGFIYLAIVQVFQIPGQIAWIFPNDSVEAMILNIAGVFFYLASIWFYLRFAQLPFMFCLGFSQRPASLFSKSFQNMKGNVGRLIKLSLSVMWWRILVSSFSCIALVVALHTMLPPGVYGDLFVNLSVVAGIMIFLLLSPYPYLAIAGFVLNLISSETDAHEGK